MLIYSILSTSKIFIVRVYASLIAKLYFPKEVIEDVTKFQGIPTIAKELLKRVRDKDFRSNMNLTFSFLNFECVKYEEKSHIGVLYFYHHLQSQHN